MNCHVVKLQLHAFKGVKKMKISTVCVQVNGPHYGISEERMVFGLRCNIILTLLCYGTNN